MAVDFCGLTHYNVICVVTRRGLRIQNIPKRSGTDIAGRRTSFGRTAAKGKEREINVKDTKYKRYMPLLAVLSAPLLIMIIILAAYKQDGAYPFGDGTVAWCDMGQQVVPLLIDFNDILSGKGGVFLNFQNAAGMNMWAVIFFFLASPFTLLTAFVQKTEMLHFANILVMLKLMTCGGTAALYLQKTCKKLHPVWVSALGMLYGLSGYGLLYFQNVMWLDMMYLFPLLLLTLELLCEKKRVLPYTLVLAAMIAVNYYIGYMVVIFIMLFMGLMLVSMRSSKKGGETAVRFAIGSAMAAMLTAVVWLPSLLQYTRSGRTKDEFLGSIKEAGFLTSYETVLPTVMCSAFALTAVIFFASDGRPRSKKLNRYLILAFLTLIPIIVEPVNLMWHTGNYMSFPSRYGFITEFMLVVCAANFLDDKDGLRPPADRKNKDADLLTSVLLVAILFLTRNLLSYADANRDTTSRFVRSLWGDRWSLQIGITVFIMMAAMITLLLVLYRKGWLSSRTLAIMCAALIAGEAFINVRTYLTMPVYVYPECNADHRNLYDLSDRISEDNMFRVKTDSRLIYVNMIGSMGYGSISHYTSLTDEDYMFMMKRLGYSSYWMEVGSYGGTELTDLLMSIKYKIVVGSADNAIYTNDVYSLVPMEEWMPSGLVLSSAAEIGSELPDTSRGEIQRFIYENTLAQYGETEAVSVYEFDETLDGNGGYSVFDGGIYTLELYVDGRQSLYMDAFDHPEVALSTYVDRSFDIQVNDVAIKDDYPNSGHNGLWKLGDFENEQVKITLNCKKDISLSSLGVTAINKDKLYAAAEAARTVNFTQKGGKLTGTVTAHAGESCLLAVPYTDGLKVKVNGSAVECRRVLGDLTVIDLVEGENSITVTALPKGLIPGLIFSIIGAALCVFWHYFGGKKLKIAEAHAKIMMWSVMLASAVVVILIYIMPVIVNLNVKKDA